MKAKIREAPTAMIALFLGFLLMMALNFTATPAFSEQMCWCCIKGEVVQVTPEECKKKGGVCYSSKDEAAKRCQPQTCWCCVKGEVVQMTPAECKEKGGVCYSSKDEAVKRCQPQTCWCCVKGEVVQMTPAECKEKGGVCYSSKDEAVKRCQPQTCWCCVKGEVVQMTPKECKEKGGVCYTTKDEALKKCKPQDDCRKEYPNPQIKFDHIDKEGRVYIPVVNWAAYSNEMFRSAPDLPPCGLNTNSSRTWVEIYDADTNNRIYGFCAFNSTDDLQKIWFLSKAKKGRVYIVLQDRACQKNYKSNTITW